MTSTTPRKSEMILVTTSFLLLPTQFNGQDDIDPQALHKAKALLNSQDKLGVFAFFAHPTAKLVSTEFQKAAKAERGFRLIYQFNFISALSKPFYAKLALEFDVDGNYQAVDWVATSALIQPFTATGAVVQMIKNRLNDLPVLRNSKEFKLLLDNADVKGLLKFMLGVTK